MFGHIIQFSSAPQGGDSVSKTYTGKADNLKLQFLQLKNKHKNRQGRDRGTTFSMHFCIDNTLVDFELKVLRKISARFLLNGYALFYIQVNGGPKNYFQLSP